ncbi:unnamed protein product [Moneuplotes crassus]|uniref:Uncharacterized protein n=1 Tax=Euplotes crassus TaxID=5936 RepID=A0AAD2D985_EUPCR|nr:unnamed protein product [Moneuplotes crassus]
MHFFRTCNKTLYNKVRDAMVILAEREANRLLLSSDNLTRNLFVIKEKPKETLKNENWFTFLINQLKARCMIKHRMYHTIPELFPELENCLRVKLAKIVFTEIKRKRKMNITMKKGSNNSNIAFTNFQELLFLHSKNFISDKYPKLIETGNPVWSAEQIRENEELDIFYAFRTYTNSEDTCIEVPKTPILAYLYLFDEFCACHCRMVAESIASKCNSETFLDEYNARWQSYVSLIEIFEIEFSFIPEIMNKLSTCGEENSLYEEEKGIPLIKFSLMRLMSRSWGKNVMKSLFSSFKSQILSILEIYQSKLLTLAGDYNIEISKKNSASRISNNYKLDPLTRDILRQAFLSILDVSLNEANIKMINHSLLPLETFYLQIEETLINHTKKFLKTLLDEYPVKVFVCVSQLYCDNICEPSIKRTQRRLNYYITDCLKRTLEIKFCKSYMKFIFKSNTSPSTRQKKLPEEVSQFSLEETKVPLETAVEKRIEFKKKRSGTKRDDIGEESYEELTPPERKICNQISDIINRAISFRKKKTLVDPKAVDTEELEKSILGSAKGRNESNVALQRQVTQDLNPNPMEEIKEGENLPIKAIHSKEYVNRHYRVQPQVALDFYAKSSEVKDLLESLEIVKAKCEENVENFEKSDKKDKYLNGYKVDKDTSNLNIPPSLHIVKGESFAPYSAFNDSYSIRYLHYEIYKNIQNNPVEDQWQHTLLSCDKDKCDYCKALKNRTVANSSLFQQCLEDVDMYDLESDGSSSLDMDFDDLDSFCP